MSVTTAAGAVQIDRTKKLPGVKALAYRVFLEDALDQLAILNDIPPEIGKNDNKSLSERILKILQDQRCLEAKYQELADEQDALRSLNNKTKFKENESSIKEITTLLTQNAQTLAKTLRSHPSVGQNLLKIQQERGVLQTLFTKLTRDLKSCVYTNLTSVINEEYKRKETLQNTINREAEASQTLKELQTELSKEKRLLDDETQERDQVIQQLKDTIQEINSLIASEHKYMKKEAKAREGAVKQQLAYKEQCLLEERQLLIKKLDMENRAHQTITDFLGRQRGQLEINIQEWMTKYEVDTESKANELETLKSNRTKDLDKFEELATNYEILQKKVADYRQEKQREWEEQIALKIKTVMATKLQRWWRVILQKLVKDKKGKKGKKKPKSPKK